MKIKRMISILVLVCFFTTQVVIKPKDAEAVVPVVPILIDAGISLLLSAGISYGIETYMEHTARNEISKLSDAEIRAIQQEGGLSELTVDDFIKHGYKKPSKFKRAFKLRGPAKAGLIGAVLSGIISGVPYVIDYLSYDEIDVVEGIERNVEYTTYTGVADGTKILYEGPFKVGEYYSISGNDCEIQNVGGEHFYTSYIRLSNGNVTIRKATSVIKTLEGNKIAVRKYYDNVSRENKIEVYVDGVKEHQFGFWYATQPILRIKASNCDYEIIGDYGDVDGDGTGTVIYNYTGSVTPTIIDTPQVQANRQRLQEVKDDPDKYIIIVEHTDGSVSLQTGTSVETGTGTETNIPDMPPGEDTPIEPSEPGEGDKPDLNKLYGVVTTRWPFSLPWDIAHLINLVACEPIPPRWEFTIPEEFGEHTFVIDMAQYEDIMIIVRWFITFGFCFGIVLAIRKLYGGSV